MYKKWQVYLNCDISIVCTCIRYNCSTHEMHAKRGNTVMYLSKMFLWFLLAVLCNYKICSYYNWGAWSSKCGSVSRKRKLYRTYSRRKYERGGCAGLKQTCDPDIKEEKRLAACKRKYLISSSRCLFKNQVERECYLNKIFYYQSVMFLFRW